MFESNLEKVKVESKKAISIMTLIVNSRGWGSFRKKRLKTTENPRNELQAFHQCLCSMLNDITLEMTGFMWLKCY